MAVVALDPLAGIDQIPWAALEHAYGKASDVPAILRALLSTDARDRMGAAHGLYSTIYHQGTLYSATPHAVPFLLSLAAHPKTPDRGWILVYLARLTGREQILPRPAIPEDPDFRAQRYRDDRKAHQRISGECRRAMADRLESIAPLASDSDPKTRASLAYLLGCLPEARLAAHPILSGLCTMEGDTGVRAAALISLARLGARGEERKQIGTHAAARASDRNGHAAERLAGAIALILLDWKQRGRRAAVATLLDAVKRPDAYRAFGALPWNDDGDAGSLEAAAAALCMLGPKADRRVLPALLGALDGAAEMEPFDAAVFLAFGTKKPRGKSITLEKTADFAGLSAEHARTVVRRRRLVELSLTPAQRRTLETLATVEWPYANVGDSLTPYQLPSMQEELRCLLGLPLAACVENPESGALETEGGFSVGAAQLAEIARAPLRYPELVYLAIRHALLPHGLPPGVAALPRLHTLLLEGNGLTRVPELVFRLERLVGLTISQNPVATIPNRLDRLPRLESLQLIHTRITQIPVAIVHAHSLTTLRIEGSPIAMHDEATRRLSCAEKLSSLTLSLTGIRALPDSFERAASLTSIDLSRNPLSSIPDVLAKLPHLKSIHLYATDVTKQEAARFNALAPSVEITGLL